MGITSYSANSTQMDTPLGNFGSKIEQRWCEKQDLRIQLQMVLSFLDDCGFPFCDALRKAMAAFQESAFSVTICLDRSR